LVSGRVLKFRARGKFYFDLSDIAYAFWHNISASERSRSNVVASLERVWPQKTAEGGAMISLSVRTSFDLFLQAVALPRGSEIVFSSVNIKDMVLIAEHYGLVVVPLDVDLATMEPCMNLLDSAVSSKTRVLLVAHIFGARFDMTPWVRAARARGLLLVEDCAESFEGVQHYSGHPDADISLFSFGAIKTCSALGGSVGWVRDSQVLERMRQLHAQYPLRSRLVFAKRLLSYACLCLLQQPLLLGLTVRVLELRGIQFESFLTGAVRGFAGSELLVGIRHQAPVAMLMLLTKKGLQEEKILCSKLICFF
jgi:perosamine synthetase